MAKKVIIFFLTLFFLFSLIFLLTPRQRAVQLLAVDNQNKEEKVDIYFVFSGGFIKSETMGKSTRERINFLKKLLKTNPDTPFVFLDYKRGKEIIDNILAKETKHKTVVSNYKYNEKTGGTENNVLELVSILKKHPEFKKIGIITSIYHERRVSIILNYYLSKEKIKNIKVYFLHDNSKQEIYSCSFTRYLKLIAHEIGGILYFKTYSMFN